MSVGTALDISRRAPGSNWSVLFNPNLWQNRQNRQRKSILPRLTTFCSAAWKAWQVVVVCSCTQAVAQPFADETGQAGAVNQQSIAAGDAFVAEVLATLQRRTNVSARLRYQSRLKETTLMGSGKYWQSGAGNQRKTCWEMQTQIAGKSASYVQVFDGNHLWTDRTLPSGRKVHRLDTVRLQSQLAKTTKSQGNQGLRQNQRQPLLLASQGQGGISEMLSDLLRRYSFSPPRPSQLNGLQVYALVGQWRPTELEKLWPGAKQGGDFSDWPEQLPHHVLLLVGKNNWFPYIIEHRRAGHAQLATSAIGDRPSQDPLLRYEIFEVLFAAAMEESKFQFKPGDFDWTDETKLVVERLRSEETSDSAGNSARLPGINSRR